MANQRQDTDNPIITSNIYTASFVQIMRRKKKAKKKANK